MSKKAALGKGLSALIPGSDELSSRPSRFSGFETSHAEVSSNPSSICEIPLDKVVTNPFQPRTTFDETALEDLAESIRTLGLIQPITVRSIGGKYQIISGERRYRAALKAGLTTIPAYIRKADDQGMLELAIVENIQREDLDSIEVALSFQRLIEECSLTQEAMAQRVGKKRATVTNYLRLLRLPAEIQAALRSEKISMGHAKALLSLDSYDAQIKLCNLITKKDLSVRQTEAKVQEMLKGEQTKDKESAQVDLPDSFYRVLEIVGKYFDNNISIKRNEHGKGSMTIQFTNDSEVESFLQALEKVNS